MFHRSLLLLFVTTFSGTVTCADGVVPSGTSGSGLRIGVTQHTNNPTPQYAGSDWRFRINRSVALLHWSTTPFVHVDDKRIQTDATLVIRLKRSLGPISVVPTMSTDHTRLSLHDENASVSMTTRGFGRADIELQVGIDDPNTAAGRYCTTVVLSVTAP